MALPQASAGAEFPQRDHGGEVERGDAGDDAERLAHGIDVDAGAGIVGDTRPSADAGCRWRIPPLPGRAGCRRLASGTVLPCSVASSSARRVIFLLDQLQEFHQHAGAALRVGRAPFRLRLFGVGDGGARALPALARAHAGLHGAGEGSNTSAKRPDVPATRLPPIKCPISRMLRVPFSVHPAIAMPCCTNSRADIGSNSRFHCARFHMS